MFAITNLLLYVCYHKPIPTCLLSQTNYYMFAITNQLLHVCYHKPIITCLLSQTNYYMFAITKEVTSKAQDVSAQYQLICHILFSLYEATAEVKQC